MSSFCWGGGGLISGRTYWNTYKGPRLSFHSLFTFVKVFEGLLLKVLEQI